MTASVVLVMAAFGRDREADSLAAVTAAIGRLFGGAPVRAVIVDNAYDGLDCDAGGATRIAGDNRVREFSAWDRGLAWVERNGAIGPDTVVVLANDTVARNDKRVRLEQAPETVASAVAGGALAGLVDEYPADVTLFGSTLRRWVDTSFVAATARTLAKLRPLAQPPDDLAVFGHGARQFFREPSPLSGRYRAYLRAYFFGEPSDDGFPHRWHAHAPLSEASAPAFRDKIRCVLCEHLLAVRAREQGVALADIRRPPRVSVVIPCFNLGAYVEEAIDSVLAQTFQDFEIVVVDDGSTDAATRAVVDGLARPRTRVVRSANHGLAAARNLGIAETHGELLCFLDADDRLRPAFLEKAVAALDRDPSATFASAWLRTFGTESWDWTPERCDLPALLCENTVLTAALVRRDGVAEIGGFDTSMPVQGDEDWDLWLRLVARGHRGVILREVLFDYRRRSGSMSDTSWYGDGHLPLSDYRFARHADLYDRHLVEVLLHQDSETVQLLRRNDEIERDIGSRLEPQIAARSRELAAMRERLAGIEARERLASIDAQGRVAELEAALGAASAEAAALRTSLSWRATAPLRSAYDRWRRLLGQA